MGLEDCLFPRYKSMCKIEISAVIAPSPSTLWCWAHTWSYILIHTGPEALALNLAYGQDSRILKSFISPRLDAFWGG